MTELDIGSTFGRYRVEGVVGRGGMGVVYRATHIELSAQVALKVMAAELARDEHFRARFQQESRLAASVRDAHAIAIHDAGEHDGLLYLAMQYVVGRDMRELVDGRPIEPGRAALLVAQTAQALDAAHSLGLVHRDVKPANVLVAMREGREHAYLTDFGLAKHLAQAGLTSTGAFLGTLDYVAPEQIEAQRVDARTDVYALGGVLVYALTGQVPYPAPGQPAKLWAQMKAPPPRPSERVPGLAPELDDVVARAMAKDPADRFASAGDLGRAAQAAVRRTVPPGERTVAVGEAAPSTPHRAQPPTVVAPPRTPAPPMGRGRTLVIVASAAVTLIALGVLAFLLLSSGGGSGASGPEVGAPVEVGSNDALSVTAGSGGVWAASDTGITRLDPKSGEIAGSVDIGVEGRAVASGDGVVWAAGGSESSGRVVQIDPESESVLTESERIPSPEALAVGEGSVWAVDVYNGALQEVSLTGEREGARIGLGDGTLRAVAAGEGAVWVVDAGSEQIIPVDPATHERGDPIDVPGAEDVAVGAGAVWVAGERGVARIDPGSRAVTGVVTLPGRASAGAVTVGDDRVWATDGFNQVVGIDPETGRADPAAIKVDPFARSLAAGDGVIWVAGGSSPTIQRIER